MSSLIEILITLPFPDHLLARLRSISPRLKIEVIKARKAEEIPADVWSRAEILYTSNALPTPEQVPQLRWIQFHWAGVDKAIDAPILRKPGLVATTLSGVAASPMAEYIVMMLLSLGHRLPDLFDAQKRADWPKDRWERFIPLELRDSAVGIVGYGSIGRQVARLLQPSGARILATKRNVMDPTDSGYTPEGRGDPNGELVHRLYPPQALRSMLKESDFVVVTVPLTAETRGLLNAEAIASMKPGAFLIDVSRGGVVDHKALIPALRDHRIAGAALDVYPEEPLSPDSPLWKLSNVILTPHISGNSQAYDQRAVELFSENLHRYLAGLPLYNRIDPDLGY
ncbi:MAG TPA: D-2-hydroxyacid dehydrogenase [Anaerolineales bacterium]